MNDPRPKRPLLDIDLHSAGAKAMSRFLNADTLQAAAIKVQHRIGGIFNALWILNYQWHSAEQH